MFQDHLNVPIIRVSISKIFIFTSIILQLFWFRMWSFNKNYHLIQQLFFPNVNRHDLCAALYRTDHAYKSLTSLSPLHAYFPNTKHF